MKKLFAMVALVCASLVSRADEGMWLPMLLGKQVYADMVKKGLKLSPDQLYSINKGSIKDAIIIFGGGCTGEIVSNQGLIFTNHHCGYDAIATASSVQNNYLRDGFWAKRKEDEIKTALSVQFLVKIDDVTKEVEDKLVGLKGADRQKKQAEVIAEINKRYANEKMGIEARISPLFKGNQFLAFVYQRYSDVRLVGTPPESIGKYGGDTDNWEWPRHTGDFSVFRVYADANGNPAAYSANNKPLKPKHFLPVSLKGVNDGDYAMTFGYPGSTNRYETSYGVKLATDINNPTLVELRDMRLKYMFEQMKKDPAVKLQLASNYAGIANYWKFFDGETKQLLKYKVFEQKQAQEAAFRNWANGKDEYKGLFESWESAYNEWRPYAKHRVYINEGILGSPLMAFASQLMAVENLMAKPGVSDAEIKKAIERATEARKEWAAEENVPSDKNILAAVTQMYFENVDKNQQPPAFYENLKANYGELDQPATYKKYAEDVFKNTLLLNEAKWDAFAKNPLLTTLQDDPAYAQASTFLRNYSNKYAPYFSKFNSINAENGRLYLKGNLAMNEGKKAMYPDATFTMRVSYGNVKSYAPRDAVKYDYVCTMKGILEKYKPGDYEFDLPADLIAKAKARDFGQYIDKRRNDLVVSFITTNDITGGNSGSPVINGNGELIGLAFDGNYEALSHKIAFDKDLNRTICVDIRYVLWCIDKLGGATNLISELKLVK